jgi:glycerol-3-phosphate dehydrogenase
LHSDSIAVLGAGSWGTALALRLAANNSDTCLWGHEPAFMETLSRDRQNKEYLPGFTFPENLTIATDLSHAVQQGRDVLLVVPSHAFREVLTRLAPALDTHSRIAWATKGLEHGSGKFMSEVLEEALAVGGTTLRDFVTSDGEPGYFRLQLRVYGRAGEPCSCGKGIIRAQVIGQRSSFYCPRCQR